MSDKSVGILSSLWNMVFKLRLILRWGNLFLKITVVLIAIIAMFYKAGASASSIRSSNGSSEITSCSILLYYVSIT